MIVVVTGGCGFLGGTFVNYVMRQHPDWHVRVLDRLTYAGSIERIDEEFRKSDRFAFVYGDILDRDLVERTVQGADVVVHYAAESHVAYSFIHSHLFTEVNIRGTAILCEALVKFPVWKVVYISSSEVYGTCLRAPMDEEHPLNPRNPYAGTKAAADRLASSYYVAFGLPLVIVRPFNCYGPFQHTEKVIAHFIQAAISNHRLEVHDDGLQTRDWTYVEDHCDAIEKIIEADIARVKGEIFNIGSGGEVSIRTIAETIVRMLRRSDSMLVGQYQRPGQIRRQVASARKAAEAFGWVSRTPFDKGLTQTIEWYLENERWWRNLISPSVPPEKAVGQL